LGLRPGPRLHIVDAAQHVRARVLPVQHAEGEPVPGGAHAVQRLLQAPAVGVRVRARCCGPHSARGAAAGHAARRRAGACSRGPWPAPRVPKTGRSLSCWRHGGTGTEGTHQLLRQADSYTGMTAGGVRCLARARAGRSGRTTRGARQRRWRRRPPGGSRGRRRAGPPARRGPTRPPRPGRCRPGSAGQGAPPSLGTHSTF
jgi:hypothetical protein